MFDLAWVGDITYGDIHHGERSNYSRYNFDEADTDMLFQLFSMYESRLVAWPIRVTARV